MHHAGLEPEPLRPIALHRTTVDVNTPSEPDRIVSGAMSTYVMIHGAWHGGWCWDKVRRRLEDAGHRVVTPDLPGHGDDRTETAAVTLDAYAGRVCEALDAQAEPVILVGHSMGGVIITAAAERRPEKVRALVYLCAFLPGDGDTLMALANQDPSTLVL